MRVADISELSINKVWHRGIPNKECIGLYVNELTNMGQFGIMLGVSKGDNLVTPLHDQLFWFGDGIVSAKDWIFLFTGPGEGTKRMRNTGSVSDGNVYTVFWGRSYTVFANSQIVPILFKVSAVHIADGPEDRAQSLLTQQ